MKAILLFTILLPFLSLCCMHDKLNFTVQTISDPDAPSGRMLAVSERQHIRIAAFYCIEY